MLLPPWRSDSSQWYSDLVWVRGVFAIPGKSCVGDSTGLRLIDFNYLLDDDFWGIKAIVKEARSEFFG